MSELPNRLGPYRILTLLGQGGMGEVYLARDERLDREVALKRLRADKLKSAAAKARIGIEARSLARLDHPNICRLYDLLEHGDETFLVLELLRGRELKSLIREGLGRRHLLELGRDIASALSAAHLAGIVHRDLKPSNILITPEGKLKLLDFGLAGESEEPFEPIELGSATASGDGEQTWSMLPMADETAVDSNTGSIAGTPMYMSPEQARGEPVGPPADVYALGLILEEMITGRAVRDAETPSKQLVLEIRSGAPRQPEEVAGELGRLRDAMLASDSSERPSAEQVRARLERLLDAPKRRLQLLSIAVVLGLLVLLGWRYVHDLGFERRQAEAARAEAEGLVDFMLEDLFEELEDTTRLAVLEDIALEVVDYYDRVPPANPESRHRRGEASLELGRILERQGRLDEAAKAFELAASVYRAGYQNGDNDEGLDLAAALDEIGDLRRKQGGLDQATAHYGESLALRHEIADEIGDTDRVVAGMAVSMARRATVDRQLGHLDESLADLTRSIELRRALVDKNPNRKRLWNLSIGLQQLAALEHNRGDLEAAQQARREAVTIRRELLSDEPEDLKLLSGLANAISGLGSEVGALGLSEEALALRRESQAIRLRLVELDPDNTDWRYQTAVDHAYLADLAWDADRLDEALEHRYAALQIRQQLVATDASHTKWRFRLGVDHNRMGQMLLEAGRTRDAEPHLIESETIHRALHESDPDQLDWRHALAWDRLMLGRFAEARGDSAGAKEGFTGARSLLEGHAEDSGNVFARAVWVASMLHLSDLEAARLPYESLLTDGWDDPEMIELAREKGLVE